VSSPCGAAEGYALPTFEPRSPSPSSSNKAGPPPIVEPGATSPDGPPTPIQRRSGPPSDDKAKGFERQPQGSLDAASALDNTQASAEPAELSEKRFFRQSVSAGFRTRVLVADSSRLMSQAAGTKAPASRDFVEPREFARTD
jgi:hypothetical protein